MVPPLVPSQEPRMSEPLKNAGTCLSTILRNLSKTDVFLYGTLELPKNSQPPDLCLLPERSAGTRNAGAL